MPLLPDHRATETAEMVKKGVKAFDDHLCGQLAALLQGQEADSDVCYAYDLYAEERSRVALDAFTLAQAEHQVINAVTEVPLSVIKVYQHLFMDMAVFRDRLDRLAYAADYTKRYGVEEHIGERMRAAVTAGVDYLRWMYASPNPQLDPRKIVRDSMVDTFYRSMVHKGNSLVSGVSKEAAKWMQNSVKYARALEELEPQTTKAGAEQLVIALKAPDMKYSSPKQDVDPKDVLH